MAPFLHILFTSTIILILTTCPHAKRYKSNLDECHNESIRGAYYPSWNADKFPPSSINTKYFTHIFYAFLNPNNVTFKFNITKTEAPLLNKFTSTLRAKRPSVRTLFSIGGGGADPDLFSRMVSKKPYRANFINSSITVAKLYRFDGCDLDYEFPQNPTDMKNFGILLDEWRKAAGPDFLITAAVYYSADTFLSGAKRAYPVDSITNNLNWTNVMNYDYHGGWDKTTGAHAALYDPKTNLSTNFGIGTWIQAGVPRCKLVMGMPLYARTWTLKDAKSHGVGAGATGVGPGDKDGTMTYDDVVKYNAKNKVTGVFDSDTVSVYSVSGNSWLGYDDPRSVAVKVSYARANDLAGYVFWQLTGDSNWTISKRASDVMLLLNQTWDARS